MIDESGDPVVRYQRVAFPSGEMLVTVFLRRGATHSAAHADHITKTGPPTNTECRLRVPLVDLQPRNLPDPCAAPLFS